MRIAKWFIFKPESRCSQTEENILSNDTLSGPEVAFS